MKQTIRRQTRGQALPEYALTIVLVAVVVIVAAALVGLAVQRVYGVILGSLGAKKGDAGVIDITLAECITSQSPSPHTDLWITGPTSEDVANLTGSTGQMVGTDTQGNSAPVQLQSAGIFLWNPNISSTDADSSTCPTAVVIQSTTGAIAVSPVTVVELP
jgi:hypothetical protein